MGQVTGSDLRRKGLAGRGDPVKNGAVIYLVKPRIQKEE